MPDFLTRIAPWARSKGTRVALALGVPSPILAAVATGLNRWLLGWGVANAAAPIQLVSTVAGYVYAESYEAAATSWLTFPQLITNGADTGLSLLAPYAASGALTYTLYWADTPPNVLSNLVVGQYAG